MSWRARAISKRWWELFFVRNLGKTVSRVCILLGMLFAYGFAYEAPVPFGFDVGVEPEGIPGWNSNPARSAGTAVGISGFSRSHGMDEWALSVAGEWGKGCFRGAFLYSYYALDSVFRQSSTMLEGAYSHEWFVAGVGFGPVAEWVPGDASWLRYRVKAGISFLFRGLALSAWYHAFTDEISESVWTGLFWKASGTLSAYIATEFESIVAGSRLSFRWGSLETAYAFPGFSLWAGVSVGFGGYALGMKYGSGGILPAWSGVWVTKTLK